MSPHALARALAAIGWSNRDLARALDCDEKFVRRWRHDSQPRLFADVPPAVAVWLAELARVIQLAHKENPAPKNWRI